MINISLEYKKWLFYKRGFRLINSRKSLNLFLYKALINLLTIYLSIEIYLRFILSLVI